MKTSVVAFVSKALAKMWDVWAMLGAVLILLLLVEGVSHIAVKIIGIDKIPMGFRARAEGFMGKVDPADYMMELFAASDVRWEPYSYWRGAPFTGKYVNISPEGIRRTVNSKRAFTEKGPLVFMFGGSPMFGFGARDGFTIPSQVSATLADKSGIRARVVNFGQMGYVSAQSLMELENELRAGRVPDLVVFLDGSNEIISQMVHNKPGLTPNETNRIREFNLLHESRAGALWTEALYSLVSHSSAYLLINRYKNRAAKHEQADSAPKEWAGMAQAYRFNISAVQALAGRYNFKALFYWQPFVFGKSSLTEYEKFIADYAGYLKPAAEEARASLGRIDFMTDGLRFTDLSGLYEQSVDPVYLDWCHFSEIGNRGIARVMAQDIADALKEKSAQ
ncbi:MAG: SGNH/GDSL hydrolase family protein [Nitrospinota bacterium]|nr:SGNH/GDSL hydrolase family protein [Nitrospinota bacterium]